jgi:hypothetical protein
VVVNIFGETANAVAAHLHLAAVGIVNFHFEVSDFRGMNREQLIRADAETTIAEFLGYEFQIADRILPAIEKNKIVARPMHLGEFDLHTVSIFEP